MPIVVDVVPEDDCKEGRTPRALLLLPDGRLVRYVWDEGKRCEYIGYDVTAEAVRHLDRDIEIHEDCRLSSLFELVSSSTPEIFDLVVTDGFVMPQIVNYRRVKKSGIIVKYDDSYDKDKIEYLEIYRRPTIQKSYEDKTKDELSGMEADFHGIGVELREDSAPFTKGDRIPWALECSKLETLLDTPLKLDRCALMSERDDKGDYRTREILCGYSLRDVVRAVFWELSFFGSPEQVDEVRDSLLAISASLASIDPGSSTSPPQPKV